MNVGQTLQLSIEKPAAGGRMIARHEGRVVLVSGAIPGEVVTARVERVQRGVVWARTEVVDSASPDRVAGGDTACGGNVLAHVRYDRQVAIKGDIVRDGFARIGRLTLPDDLSVTPSPIDGHRMRARVHVVNGRLGFYREGTHQLCDPAATRQLLPATLEVLAELERHLAAGDPLAVSDVEISENCAGNQRALHLVLGRQGDPSRVATLVPPIVSVGGLTCAAAGASRALDVWGDATVSDALDVETRGGRIRATVSRHAHAFFQANRFLLNALVVEVADAVPSGSLLDLYAGVGLFAVTLAARGDTRVVAVEGDRTSAADLAHNARRCAGEVHPRHESVEAFLATVRPGAFETVLVDPPRTGMTKEALNGALALAAPHIVYVSCDVATLARDARLIVDAGYQLARLHAFDLFPQTAHVECVTHFIRQ